MKNMENKKFNNDSKSGLCPQKTRSFLSHSNQEDLKISTELVKILNTGIKIPFSQSSKKQELRDIQKIENFLSLKFLGKIGGNSRWN